MLRIPKDLDVVEIAVACMKIGSSAMYRVPGEIALRFGLREIKDEEYERLFPTDGK